MLQRLFVQPMFVGWLQPSCTAAPRWTAKAASNFKMASASLEATALCSRIELIAIGHSTFDTNRIMALFAHNRRISINLRLQALCQVEGVGFFNMWEHFEQGDGLFSKDGLHLNKRGAAVLGKGFLRVLGDGIGQLSLN